MRAKRPKRSVKRVKRSVKSAKPVAKSLKRTPESTERTAKSAKRAAKPAKRSAAPPARRVAALERKVETLAAELSAALDQQTATADILRVIAQSPTDVGPVMQAVADAALRFCGARDAVVHLRQGDRVSVRAQAGMFGQPIDADFPLNRDSAMGRSIVDAATVHLPDMEALDPVEWAQARRFAGTHGHKASVAAPMLRDGVAIGSLLLRKGQAGPFTPRQIELLEAFAAQAAIAIENARLIAETREALDQQTATAEVLHVINASPGDLAPVFDAVLDKATRLCDFAFSILWMYDGEAFRAVAMHGVPPRYADYLAGRAIVPPPGAEGAFGQFVGGRDFVHIDDVAATPPDRLTPRARGAVEMGGARTNMLVALRKDGRLLGAIEAYRTEVRPFSEKQVGLLQSFAAQAVLAIENARLINETREALDQQTATAEVLQVINSSPGDLAPVFDAMLEKAMRLCEASFGHLAIYDGTRFDIAVSRGVSPAFVEHRKRHPPDYGPDTAPGRLLAGERVVHYADLKADALYAGGDASVRAIVDLGGARTNVLVALAKDNALLGLINIYRTEVRPFSDKQIALLQSFAAQAVIAIENARLLGELRERTRALQESLEYQTATAEVLKIVASSPDRLEPVFDAMLERATALCGVEAANLYLYEDGVQVPVAARHPDPEKVALVLRNRLRPGPDTASARAISTKAPIHIPDLTDDVAYRRGDPFRVRMVEELGVRALLAVPLLRLGEAIGVMVVYRPVAEPFTDGQIALVKTFADQAVIAIENARLINETREALAQQTATAEVLQVINASPGDLAPVFDAMLERAMRLCEADDGHMAIFDGDDVQIAATRGVAAGFAEFCKHNPPGTGPGSVPARLRAGEHVIHIPDLKAEEIYARGDPTRRALVDLGGARTALVVALAKDERVLGFLNIHRTEVRPFTDKQIALLRSFAAQAVIAMENARLLGELRERTADLQESLEYQTATSDVLKVISRSTFDLQPVLDTVIATAARLCQAYIAGLVVRRGTEYRYVATTADVTPEYDAAVRALSILPGRGTVAARVLLERRVVHVLDVEADPEYVFQEATTIGRIRTALGVPLLREGDVIGVFVLVRRQVEAFAEYQIELVRTFADQAVIAIENARLLTETRSARDAAEGALRDLKAAQANLIQAEKMASLGQLTAGIAHEIKNPLNFVNNFASLSNELLGELKEIAAPALAALDADKRAELDDTLGLLSGNLDKIAEHGRRADNIVKSMLAHSRGGSGERQSVDLNALLEESLNLAYHGARAQDQGFNITLERDFDAGLPAVELVPQDITRVFLNLFGNGFYAAKKRAQADGDGYRPVLRVATRDAGDAVEIRVRDNGTGVPAAIRDKLFQPFFTTKPTGEGTGLGLSISYDIVTQQHGGTIAVDSEEGAFTEFTIRLPRGGPSAR
jgi:GAF domain-containing protein